MRDLEEKRAESGSIQFEKQSTFGGFQPETVPAAPVTPPAPVHEEAITDELTEKLKKLRTLFDKGLISQEEYNHKKLELLSDL